MGRIILLMVVCIALERTKAVREVIKDDCLLTFDEFDTFVTNQNWLSVYVLDYRSENSDMPDLTNFRVRFEKQDNEQYRMPWSMTQNNTGECFRRVEHLFKDVGEAAILKSLTYNENNAEKYQTLSFVGNNPGSFLLVAVCYGRMSSDGCPDFELSFHVPANVYDKDNNGVLDADVEVLKTDMVKEAKRCLSLGKESDMKATWDDNVPVCPLP